MTASGPLTDYVLAVAVAGIDAVTSALPGLRPQAVVLGLAMIAVLLASNLRGVRQAGNLLAVPTYAFMLAMFLLIVVGLAQVARRRFAATPPPRMPATQALTVLLVLRAFTSGVTSMTGIEVVSNAVPAFQPAEWRNAHTTLRAFFIVKPLVRPVEQTEPLAVARMTSTSPRTDPGAPLLSYPAMLDLSPHSLRLVRDLIIRDRRRRGGSWYRMPPGRQGLLVLVWFRKNHTFAELAGGFDVGLTTAWRYVQQVLSLLAPLAASLPHALAAADRNRFIILDGTCISIDRVTDRRYWCGKHRRYQVNIQALISPEGDPVWTSSGRRRSYGVVGAGAGRAAARRRAVRGSPRPGQDGRPARANEAPRPGRRAAQRPTVSVGRTHAGLVRPGQVMEEATFSADFMASFVVSASSRASGEARLRRLEAWFASHALIEEPIAA